jgi:hypothetical protein
MSYDGYIKIAHRDGYTTHIEVGNMTTNVDRMMVPACGVRLRWFNGLTCETALPILAHAHHELRRHPRKFKRLEYTEWGSYDDFLPWLTRFYVLVRLHPTGTIEVGW